MHANINLKNIALIIFITISLGWISIIGSSIILPFLFAFLLATFLYPIDKFYNKYISYDSITIVLSFATVILPILLVATLFSFQIMNIMESLPSIGDKLDEGINQASKIINNLIPFADIDIDKMLASKESDIPKGSFSTIAQGFVSSATFLVNFGLTMIYTFFLLYYRKSFKNFIIFQFEEDNREDTKNTLKDIKETVKSYIGGVGLVMVILSVLNSIGLSIIGIDYPIFWGVLAGMLAIIPYIGTGLGGLLPFVYALSTTDTTWQPVAIVIYYVVIQQVEGNLITPKIVGDKVDINPLFAILSIVIFGTMWGVGGIILALPLISISRIILSHFEYTEPIAMLMSSSISEKPGKFKKWAKKVED